MPRTKIYEVVHTSLGHLGSDKRYVEIKGTFNFRNLGRKLRKLIAACDLCQRTKHMNRAYDVTEIHHPRNVQENCVVDLHGSLPTSRGNVRFIFVYYDMFYKYVKLHPLKSAKTKACLNKFLNHSFVNINKPEV